MELYFKENIHQILNFSYMISNENNFAVFTFFKKESKPFMTFEKIRPENGYIFKTIPQEIKILQSWNVSFKKISFQYTIIKEPFEYSKNLFKTLNIKNHSEFLIVKILEWNPFIYKEIPLLNYPTKYFNINFLFV